MIAAVRRHSDTWLAASLLFITLIVYLRTLCPTIYWGDCGELAAAAFTLGIAHPTGYPVWTMLAKAWSVLLPVGSVIWRMNAMSAFFGAVAVAALYGFGRLIGLPRPIAFASAGMFAFTQTFWQQCEFAETYSLTTCYTCAILYCTARWRTLGCREGDLIRLAIVYGFAMTNGQINTLFLPGVVAFILWSQPSLLVLRQAGVRKQWLRALSIGLLPLLTYAYLPLRARMQPTVNWGDPETLSAFYYHISGRSYAPLMFHLPTAYVWMNFRNWAAGLKNEYPGTLIAVAAFGLGTLWSRRESRPLALLLSWVLIADVGYTIDYAIYNRYIYFIPAYVVLAVLAGCGLADAWPRLEALIEAPKRQGLRNFGAAALVVMIIPQAMAHWQRNDLHNNWTCEDYGRNLLSSVPAHGLLIDNGGDECHSAIIFLRDVEGVRPDIVYVHRNLLCCLYDFVYHEWANLWYWRQIEAEYPPARTLFPSGRITELQAGEEDVLRRLIAQAVGAGRSVCIIRPQRLPAMAAGQGERMTIADYLSRTYATADVGLLTRVYARGNRPSNAVLLVQTQQVWASYSMRGIYDGMYLDDGFLTPIAIDYADADLARARLDETQGRYTDAAAAYSHVLRLFQSDEATAGLDRCAQKAAAHPPVS